MAGPKRPEGRVALPAVAEAFASALTSEYKKTADARHVIRSKTATSISAMATW